MSLHHFMKWTFISCVLVFTITYFYKDILPNPSEYKFFRLEPPVQTPTEKGPFNIVRNQQNYTITPKFDYELTGVVVTYSNADGLTNIWHHRRWKDFINVRDLCVLWGANVSTGVYRKLEFTSDSWTCWVSWKNSTIQNEFNMVELSNNHLLTNNDRIKASLLKAEIGDVISFKGMLAEYKNNNTGGTRGTSTSRTDTGNHACETVYVNDFKIIKKANPSIRRLHQLSKWGMLLSLVALIVLSFISPHKPY